MKALAVKALYSVLGRLSLNSLRRTGFFLGTLLYYLSPSRRKAAIKNARVIGAENPVKTARKACRHNMASFMESFYNGRIDQDFVKNRLKVTFIGEKPDFERTYFIVTAHFGSWELSSGLYRNYIQKDLGLLARRFKDPEIDNLVQKLRGDSEMITYLHHRNCTEDMLRLLGDGVNIAALLDHSATMKDCIMVPLFGIKTTFIKGIPTLSAKMDIPLLPAFFKRTNEGVELIMYPPIEPDKSLKPRERIYDLALRVNKVYEDLFSRYPEQWYLIHKRFKKQRMKMERLPTVFIDRDGTINIESGYINHPVNFRLYPFAAQAIRILNEHGIQVVVVTNQAGVGRGYFDENHVNMLHTLMKEKLKSQGAHIDALYYCPHHSSSKDPKYSAECDCRKPSPGMVNKALAELPVDRERMFVIGDRKGDMKLAENTGACGIMVRTGYGEGELIKEKNIPAEVITDNLLTAVYEVLSRIEQD